MTTDSDYQRLSINPVGDYMAGEDAAFDRAAARRKSNTEAGILDSKAALISGEADDAAYGRGRKRGLDTASADATTALMAGGAPGTVMSNTAAPAGFAAPVTLAVGPGATGLSATGPGPAASGPSPQAPAQTSSRGDYFRQMATAAGKFGSPADVQKHLGDAHTADFMDAFNAGATSPAAHPAESMTRANSMPAQPGVPGLAIGRVSAPGEKTGMGSKTVKDSHGKDTQYSVTTIDPSMQGYSFMANETDLRQIAGYSAAMKVDPAMALEGIAKIDTHLAALFATKLKQTTELQTTNSKTVLDSQQGESAIMHGNAALRTAAAHEKTADATMARVSMEKTKQSFGAPVNVVDKEGNAVVMQPYMVNGKMTFEKVELPDGARFPKQAPEQKFEKTGDGAGIMRSASTGNILFRVADNTPLPAEVNPFAGKEGEKTAAEWKSQGVTQGVTRLPDGTMKYFYESAASPADPQTGAGTWSTPQEAAAAGKTAQAKGSAMKGPKWPVAGAGRGLTSPPMAVGSSASGEDDYDAASQQADMARSKLDRSKAFARGQVRAPTAQPGTGIALE